jgi:hypothetical protein
MGSPSVWQTPQRQHNKLTDTNRISKHPAKAAIRLRWSVCVHPKPRTPRVQFLTLPWRCTGDPRTILGRCPNRISATSWNILRCFLVFLSISRHVLGHYLKLNNGTLLPYPFRCIIHYHPHIRHYSLELLTSQHARVPGTHQTGAPESVWRKWRSGLFTSWCCGLWYRVVL